MPMNEEVRKAPPQNVADAVRIDYAPGELDRTAPERIWLQIDSDGDNNERDEPWPGDEVTWCADSIGGLEIQYIRADLLRAELTRLTEIADSVDPLVVRLGEVTTRLEAANARVELLTIGNLSYAQDNANLLGRESVALKRLEAANALLREFAGAVIDTAFKMPAPNSWTPVFVQMAQHAQRRADEIDAHLSEPRT